MWKKYCFNWSSFSCCFSFFASFLFAIFFNSFSIGIWKMRKANGEEKAKARVKWGKKKLKSRQTSTAINFDKTLDANSQWRKFQQWNYFRLYFVHFISHLPPLLTIWIEQEKKKKSLFDMKTRRTEKSAFEVQKTRRTDNQTRKFNKVKYDCDSIDSMRIDDNGQCQIGRLQKGKWKEHEETANKIAWAKRRTVQRI